MFGCNAAAVLENNFDSVFARFNGLLEVGVPGPAGFSVIFDGPDPIITYLPAEQRARSAFAVDLLDPVLTASSALSGAEWSQRRFNVMFSNDGLLAHPTRRPVQRRNLVLRELRFTGRPQLRPGDRATRRRTGA